MILLPLPFIMPYAPVELRSHPLPNGMIMLPRRRTLRRFVHWLTTNTSIRRINILGLLKLNAALLSRVTVGVIAIISLVRVERVTSGLITDRGTIWRGRISIWLTTVVGLVGVIVSGLLTDGWLSCHPACAIHWGYSLTATATGIEA